MAALSSKLPLRIASVALTFRNLRFSLRPLIDGKRSTNIDSFSEGAVRFSARIAFVACVWLNQFSFASSFRFGGHFVPSNVVHTKIAPRTVLELKVESRKTEFSGPELNAKAVCHFDRRLREGSGSENQPFRSPVKKQETYSQNPGILARRRSRCERLVEVEQNSVLFFCSQAYSGSAAASLAHGSWPWRGKFWLCSMINNRFLSLSLTNRFVRQGIHCASIFSSLIVNSCHFSSSQSLLP